MSKVAIIYFFWGTEYTAISICLLVLYLINAAVSRLLVASMQSICLEGMGGENRVDPRLQETTFIQHTFGGNLRSKVLNVDLQMSFIKLMFIINFIVAIYPHLPP